ncbi:hypothetical protein CLV30_108174 [Haloactinopolyspora alba]|uniref:Uncharacterized protein n=1 Tax=Haloactinopolyspora alba TaxID=648780 RepID=A0A2P8E1B4_9ACTN|nr:hypothetical protein [Haloactinopolyspora alba]PSL03262.1 hypothetical protein CLV30_108174 [Haloactinopolyspora alba]
MARRWLWSVLFVCVLALPGCGDDAEVQQELADRAAEIGVSAELIRVVDLPDHQPAWQSVSAPAGAVDAETLRQAVEGAHAPDAGELEELFPAEHRPPERTPVERGDLPPHGDGAPQNPDGTGQEG